MKTALLRFTAPLILLGGLMVSGCATPAQSNAMVSAPTMGAEKHHEGSIGIAVTGGSETSAAGASKISNEDFAAALSQSIEKSGLFSNVVPAGGKGAYHLDVAIVRLDQPMFGFSMTVTIETSWTLSRVTDGSVLWRKGITSSYTASAGSAFAGVTRLRLANEGAARENILNAIVQMGKLTLD